MMHSMSFAVIIAVLIFGGALLLLELGFRYGRSTSRQEAPDSPNLGAVLGAVLGLLGLLLGFSFAGAAARFIERQDIIVREANTIGTAYLRADLLEEPHRSALKNALRVYTDDRIEAFRTRAGPTLSALIEKAGQSHQDIWAAAVEGVRAQPTAIMAVLPPVNEVIDLHTTRLSSSRRHLPPPVLGILMTCAGIALGMVGYSTGLRKKRHASLTTPLALLIAAVLWVTIDLDYPKRGIITINQDAMESTRAGMTD